MNEQEKYWYVSSGTAYNLLSTEQKAKYHVTMHDNGHCSRHACWVCGPTKNGKNLLDSNLRPGATQVTRVLLALDKMDRNVMADRLADHPEKEVGQ